MSALVILLLAIAGFFLFVYLLLRFNRLWIYKLLDRSLRNERHRLDEKYQVPRYFVLNKEGEPDRSVKWPGWDGWYFFLLPEDEDFPIKMIRCSLMTGLYGLDGIDSYEKLREAKLDSFHAAEYLTLIPSDWRVDGTKERENNLFQTYLPKATDLAMKRDQLDTAVTAAEANSDADSSLYGRISGAWPDYRFQFVNSETGFRCDLTYKGANITWWADIRNVFTYFAAFGEIEGEISYLSGEADRAEEVHRIRGSGAFEHGFARKPFNYDSLWRSIKLLQKVFRSWNPIRYNYQLFIGRGSWQGGFMLASGFGINFRNLGGFYINGAYRRIKSVKIKYLNDPKPDVVTTSGRAEKFYHRWIVKAETDEGTLEYLATRQGPPPSITGNMIYYFFTYEGSYRGESISGRGYGEYLTM